MKNKYGIKIRKFDGKVFRHITDYPTKWKAEEQKKIAQGNAIPVRVTKSTITILVGKNAGKKLEIYRLWEGLEAHNKYMKSVFPK